MADQAHLIVKGSMLNSRFVDVVARRARESRITIFPAAALLQTVGRKPQYKNPSYVAETDVGRSAVTGAAEVNRIIGSETRRIENQRRSPCIVFQAHLRHVLGSRTVACFTSDALNQSIRMKHAIRT